MRLYYVIFTMTVVLAANDAMLTSDHANDMEPSASDLYDWAAKRLLRTRRALENGEERGWKVFVAKLKRLGKYNIWNSTKQRFRLDQSTAP
ncbi:RxLR effector protein [Phytophthora megakarya]|uniref:RxLR effector protein n=1 Tax=Phytophthora megakarya TaxID=4795 RepID=A0A225V245_9STRA|nr:RxLR effector protein [Phytophthora megakarya]